MIDVQPGQSVSRGMIYWPPPPNAWRHPIKFEEYDKWELIDSTVARAVTLATYIKEGSEISFDELVNRVYVKLRVEKPFLEEVIIRILRHPPFGPNRKVKSYIFRQP